MRVGLRWILGHELGRKEEEKMDEGRGCPGLLNNSEVDERVCVCTEYDESVFVECDESVMSGCVMSGGCKIGGV